METRRLRLERVDDRVYFTDSHGVRWRVYDVGFGTPHASPGRVRVYPPESARANHRYFVSAELVRRVYAFQRAESRALDQTNLARQLSAAGYLGTRSVDAPRHPTR